MSKNIKSNKCLNCGHKLAATHKYCPRCGQEIINIELSFGKLIHDFFANYFSFDSRFGRSLKPFFLSPGKLTNEFIAGKRVKYANPIRLYIIISLVHFFILSIYSNYSNSTSTGVINETDSVISNSITIRKLNDKTLVFDESRTDTITINRNEENTDLQDMNLGEKLMLIKELAPRHSITEIADSLDIEKDPFFEKVTLKQLIKLEKSGTQSLRSYLIKNIPILMFFLLPIYALVLKLFFRKILYINHVIHSLHLHSFLFALLIPFWLISILFDHMPDWFKIPFMITFLVYLFASFMNIYKISFWQAASKIMGSGFVYVIIFGVSLLITFLISFYTY